MSIFKKKSILFSNEITPLCKYCFFSNLSSDETMVLCEKKGVVSLEFSCSKFEYLPTKRIPKRRKELKTYKKEDFIL